MVVMVMAQPNNDIPIFGLGTYKNKGEQVTESVKNALELGYRHIDTAQVYENEAEVGKGIEESSVPREELFIASKVWNDRLDHEGVIESTRESLERLKIDRVDLMYVHWPADKYAPGETLPAFDELVERDLIGQVGVSNFEPEHMDKALEVAESPIAANQVELHPLFRQDPLREYCDRHDITIVAYAPIARGKVFDHPVLTEIADKHDATAPQVSLAWLRQNDLPAIPKATGRDHLVENWKSQSVTLTEEDMSRIDGLEEERLIDPSFSPW